MTQTGNVAGLTRRLSRAGGAGGGGGGGGGAGGADGGGGRAAGGRRAGGRHRARGGGGGGGGARGGGGGGWGGGPGGRARGGPRGARGGGARAGGGAAAGAAGAGGAGRRRGGAGGRRGGAGGRGWHRSRAVSPPSLISRLAPRAIAVGAVAGGISCCLSNSEQSLATTSQHLREVFWFAPAAEGPYLAENVSAMTKMMIDMLGIGRCRYRLWR